MNRKPRVFLSRTTKGLATLADKVAVVLDDMGFEVIHQPDFTMSWRKIRHMLMEKLRECDAVLCLVGPAYGFAPKTPIPEFRDPDTGRDTFSYTQIEYLIARRLHRPVFTILVQDDCATFPLDPFTQDDKEHDLQRDFIRDTIKKDEHLRYGYTTHDEFLEAIRKTVLPRDLSALPPSYPENIPFPSIGKIFTGRSETLRELRETLVAAGSTSPAVQIVHGTGGVGKTRVTVEYSHIHKPDYKARLFVTGSSPEALDSALANLAGIFLLNLEEQDEKENDVRIAAVLSWLALHPGWLLVIDNVDTQEARDHALHIVGKLPPGHVLITTRLHTWPGDLLRTPLDVLSDTDGRDVLLGYRSSPKAEAEETDAADALALAHDLDGLALALEQAAAYLNRIAITIAEYHQRWKTNADRVKAWHDPETMTYPASVATTWLTSFEQLNPASQSLLNLLAWFAPDPIPRFLLKPLAEKKVQPDPLNGTDPAKALGELTDFSLTKPDRKGLAFSVHRLIQEVAMERQEPPEPSSALISALAWINSELPTESGDVSNWPIVAPLVPHAVAAAKAGIRRSIFEPSGRLFNQIALLETAKANYQGAESLLLLSLASSEKSGTVDIEIRLAPLCNLAQVMHATNRFEEAESLLRQALKMCEAQTSRDSSLVARIENNLAEVLRSTDRIVEAEPLMERSLKSFSDGSAVRSRDACASINNLAALLHRTNRIEEAEPLMRDAMNELESLLGADHPDVARVINNLALLLKETNRLQEAEYLLRRAIVNLEKALGDEHPSVATSLSILVHLLQDQARFDEAEPLARRALEIDTAVFGDKHPDVARDTINLANILRVSNNHEDAEALMLQALSIDEASLGKNHPNVAIALNNLANLYHDTNRLHEAECFYRRALAIDEIALGNEHPKVAVRLNNLGQLLKDTGRLIEAEPHMRRMLEIFLKFRQKTGFEHEGFTTGLDNYFGLLVDMGLAESIAVKQVRVIAESFGVRI